MRIRDIYLMFDWDTCLFKIGSSDNCQIRLKEIREQYPKSILVYSFLGEWKTEYAMHRLFDDKRVHGEWFNLDHEDVTLILRSKARDFYKSCPLDPF